MKSIRKSIVSALSHRFDGGPRGTESSAAGRHPDSAVQYPRPVRAAHSRRVAGFTLVELSIVVTIAAILGTAAVPGFMSQVRKARRWDAMVSIVRIQQSQERWRGSNATYADAVTTLAAVDASLTASSERAYYTLATAATEDAPGSGYSVTATAVAGASQASDTQCTRLSVTVSGNGIAYAPENCWSR